MHFTATLPYLWNIIVRASVNQGILVVGRAIIIIITFIILRTEINLLILQSSYIAVYRQTIHRPFLQLRKHLLGNTVFLLLRRLLLLLAELCKTPIDFNIL